MDTRLAAIKHKLLVMSGKGGVDGGSNPGWSSRRTDHPHVHSPNEKPEKIKLWYPGFQSGSCPLVMDPHPPQTLMSEVEMSIEVLAGDGQRVGLLDVDVCGPSSPHLLGVADQPVLDSRWGWQPVTSPLGKIKTLSVGSLLSSQSQAVVWKGPRKAALIRQMIKDTLWGRLDTLVVDTPPGTSDEHLTVIRLLAAARPSGAVVLTSPQCLSAGVVSRQIMFCQKMNIPVLGIIENMSRFCCPCCFEVSELFPGAAGAHLADKYGVPLLGALPLHMSLADAGMNPAWRESPVAQAVREIVNKIKEKL